MSFIPLTVLGDKDGNNSFVGLLRNNPPPGQNFEYASPDAIMRWAENDPLYSTYFKPRIKNLPSGNKFHNPEVPIGTMMPNPVYIQDLPEYKESLDPEHLKYLGHNVEQMFSDLGSGIAGGLGWMEDPEGMAKFRTNALEILADKTKWQPITQFWFKSLAKLSEGAELDPEDPEYKQAKKSANEWYSISEAYLKTGEHLAAERMANSTELRGYFRWMEGNPMTVDNFYHGEQFKRAMSEMLPSVTGVGLGSVLAGPVGAAAMMFAMEGSGEWSEVMRILTEEGIIKKDEAGNPIMEPEYIVTPDNMRIKNPKFGEPVREVVSFEEAAPIAGQTSLIYTSIAAPLELFQIGRATRLLNIGSQVRKSFVLKMIDNTVRKSPLLVKAPLYVADFGLEAVEGGLIEWFQTTLQMTANKAIEEGYGNNSKEALEALAHELGPMLIPNMASEEIGMSSEARQSFWLGLVGEAGFGAIGGPGRMAYTKYIRGDKIPTFFSYQAGTKPEDMPSRPIRRKDVEDADFGVGEGEALVPVVTTGTEALAIINTAPDKSTAAVAYANILSEQVTPKGEYFGAGVNALIVKSGGSPNEDINKLIQRDSLAGIEERPDRKVFNLIKSLDGEPDVRKQVLDIVNNNPVLKVGVAAIQKDIAKTQLDKKDKGTSTAQSQAEQSIDAIPDEEILENLDNVEQIVNDKFEEDGIDATLDMAEEQAIAEADETALVEEEEALAEKAAAKQMGVPVAEYRKQKAKAAAAQKVKKTKKAVLVKPLANINKVETPQALDHLVNTQRQSGTLGVKDALTGKKKGKVQVTRANLTTLKQLQKAIFQEERIPTTEANRGAIIDLISEQLHKDVKPTQVSGPTKLTKAPTKKKVVKAITKREPVTAEPIVTEEAPVELTSVEIDPSNPYIPDDKSGLISHTTSKKGVDVKKVIELRPENPAWLDEKGNRLTREDFDSDEAYNKFLDTTKEFDADRKKGIATLQKIQASQQKAPAEVEMGSPEDYAQKSDDYLRAVVEDMDKNPGKYGEAQEVNLRAEWVKRQKAPGISAEEEALLGEAEDIAGVIGGPKGLSSEQLAAFEQNLDKAKNAGSKSRSKLDEIDSKNDDISDKLDDDLCI